MQGFEGSHAGIDFAGRFMSGGIPAFGETGRSGIDCVVSLVIEGDSLEAVLAFLDIGAGSDSIVFEEH